MGYKEKMMQKMMGAGMPELVKVIESLHAYQEEMLKAQKKILIRLDAICEKHDISYEDKGTFQNLD